MNIKKIEVYLKKYNKNIDYPINVDIFVNHAKRYIKAIKENRMICVIDSVSPSGMSRTLKFLEMDGKKENHHIYNFYQLFDIMGHQKVKNSDSFRIYGCGMDMVFNTNYNLIHNFAYMGIITKKTAEKLCQQIPHKV